MKEASAIIFNSFRHKVMKDASAHLRRVWGLGIVPVQAANHRAALRRRRWTSRSIHKARSDPYGSGVLRQRSPAAAGGRSPGRGCLRRWRRRRALGQTAAKGLASVGCAVAGFSQFAMQLQDQPPIRNDRQNQEQ